MKRGGRLSCPEPSNIFTKGIFLDSHTLNKLLDDVRDGRTSVEKALERLKSLPFEDLGFAKIDNHRALRHGFPEVVFAEGKKTEQIAGILERLMDHSSTVMATRVKPDVADKLSTLFPEGIFHKEASLFVIKKEFFKVRGIHPRVIHPKMKGHLLVLSAGTSDIPVAEEAALTAHYMGNPVEKIYDVGVAGLHRLLSQTETIQKASVIIVVAGMDGALPSVVCGLAGKPVIGVPTSIGYGASLKGLTPLLTMLSSCAPGMTVVNIDNGFGAAYAATLMNRLEP